MLDIQSQPLRPWARYSSPFCRTTLNDFTGSVYFTYITNSGFSWLKWKLSYNIAYNSEKQFVFCIFFLRAILISGDFCPSGSVTFFHRILPVTTDIWYNLKFSSWAKKFKPESTNSKFHVQFLIFFFLLKRRCLINKFLCLPTKLFLTTLISPRAGFFKVIRKTAFSASIDKKFRENAYPTVHKK